MKLIPHLVAVSFAAIILHNDKQQLCEWLCLTLLVGREKDAEATFAARLVCPHSDDAECGDQHDVVGHRGAELALQILHRTEKTPGQKYTGIGINQLDVFC